MIRQGGQAPIVATDGHHGHLGVERLESDAGGMHMGCADVQGHIGGGPEAVQEGGHLAGAAGAKLHNRDRRPAAMPCAAVPNVLRMALQQVVLQTGEMVFRLLADGLKEPGALLVVEQPWGKLPGSLGQALLHGGAHVARTGMQVDQFRARQKSRAAAHQARHRDASSRARRRPEAIQRLRGGKKLR